MKANTPEEASELIALRDSLSTKNQPLRDGNGFRRIILALSSSGKLSALHNGDGRVLWSRAYHVDVDGGTPQFMLRWRTFHDLTHAPQVCRLWTI